MFWSAFFEDIIGEIGLLSFLYIGECGFGFVTADDIEIVVSHLECHTHIITQRFDELELVFARSCQDSSGEHRSRECIGSGFIRVFFVNQ